VLAAEVRQVARMFLGESKTLAVFAQARLKSLLLRVHRASLSTLPTIFHLIEVGENTKKHRSKRC
jgi:hypothetical protein